MLFVSLVLSALILSIVNGAVWLKRTPARSTDFNGLALSLGIGSLVVMCILPAVGIQAFLLFLSLAFWRESRRVPLSFPALSCGATLLAYGVFGVGGLTAELGYARLCARYPYESMEGRLPLPNPVPAGTTLGPDAVERLGRLEGEIPERWNTYRAYQLKRLHEHAVALFIDSAGFGNMRMIFPNEQNLAANLRRGPVPLQPGPRVASTWSPGELKPPSLDDRPPMGHMLEDSILDFANPGGFGYVKDRRQVAGFEPHRFSRIPGPANRWEVQTVELVGLLLHDEPVVYVSESLPRMDTFRGASTRPPDRFESYGLDALRRGEDLFITQEGAGMRMLGAVRSIKQCVDCHGGSRGDLLGAFSYTLRAGGGGWSDSGLD